MRHRAEACDRIALADVRPLAEPGAATRSQPWPLPRSRRIGGAGRDRWTGSWVV